jgi:hypothetical protein
MGEFPFLTGKVYRRLKFIVTTGSRYLGALDVWIQEKIENWSGVVVELGCAAKVYPQAAFSGLRISLQQERQFVQRVIKEIRGTFTEIEKAYLKYSFLLSLVTC